MGKDSVLTRNEIEQKISTLRGVEKACNAQSLSNNPPRPIEEIKKEQAKVSSEVKFWRDVLNS